jgi:murein DD-endopeptidase MepM/ murein hydrolase activator NlpD
MGRDNRIYKTLNRFRTRSGYYTTGGKNLYKSQLKKIIISLILVLIILLIKLIDTKGTNEAIRIVDNIVNKDFDLKEDTKKVIEYVKSISKIPNEVITTFNTNVSKDIPEDFIAPVTKGTVYRSFGNQTKSRNIKVFYKGIDILTTDRKVMAITDGIVIETGRNGILGRYIKIEHRNSIQSVYGYLEKVNVTVGKKVRKGQIIGTLSEINNERNLLHLEIWENNTPVNPLNVVDMSLQSSELR